MKRKTIENACFSTLSWHLDRVVDWVYAGKSYNMKGEFEQMGLYHLAYSFDSVINSQCGKYSFVYKRLGTKGIILKKGEILREINRSYYYAEEYEYPAAFITLENGRVLLAHCPSNYCRIDFEDIETGELITNSANRKPDADIFHSRLEVSPDNKHLISKGWLWHPWDTLCLYDIHNCIKTPSLLDELPQIPGIKVEVCTASFIDNDNVLIGTSSAADCLDESDVNIEIPLNSIAIWNFKANKIVKAMKMDTDFGNLIAIDETYCWDLYEYPKIINVTTGKVEFEVKEIQTGLQKTALLGSVEDNFAAFAYSRKLNKLAIKNGNNIEILWKE
jgi:hypothetical protein